MCHNSEVFGLFNQVWGFWKDKYITYYSFRGYSIVQKSFNNVHFLTLLMEEDTVSSNCTTDVYRFIELEHP
jgi:hypothetical protein